MEKAFELIGYCPKTIRGTVVNAVANCYGPKNLAEMITIGAEKLQLVAWDDFRDAYQYCKDADRTQHSSNQTYWF